jgi:hypothetical protein
VRDKASIGETSGVYTSVHEHFEPTLNAVVPVDVCESGSVRLPFDSGEQAIKVALHSTPIV